MPTVTKFANANTVVTTGWTSPTDAYSDNAVYATAAPGKNSDITTDWGFPAFTTSDIPAGSTINSVTIEIQYKSSTTGSTGAVIGLQINNNGTLLGSETTFGMNTADQTVTKQATSGIALADLQTANLVKGRVRGHRGSSNTAITWSVDYVKVTVDYTVPPLTLNPSDTITLSDSATKTTHYSRSFADTITLNESSLPTLVRTGALYPDNAIYPRDDLYPSDGGGGGTNWTLTPSDTLTLSDAVVKVVSKALADSFTLSDVAAKAVGKPLADTITLSDGAAKAIGLPRSDTITLSEALAKALGLSRSDTTTLSDAVVKALGLPRGDTITLSDIFSKVSGKGVSLADTITLSDAIAKSVVATKADTITLTDGFGRTWTILRSQNDTITLSDLVAKAAGLGRSDSLTLSDAIGKAIGASRADQITLNDAVGKALAKALADVLTQSDNMTPTLTPAGTDYTLNLADTITLADAFHRYLTDEGIPTGAARRARTILLSRFGIY